MLLLGLAAQAGESQEGARTRPQSGSTGERWESRGQKLNMIISSSDTCYKLHTKVQTAPGLGLPGFVGV